MTSIARQELTRRLKDFDEIIQARDAICPTGAGRPANRQGQAVVRGGVVLLSASFEAYVEELFDDAVDLIYASATGGDRNSLKNDTSGSLHNASVFKVNRLFFNIGIPWIMSHQRVRWQKFTNSRVREELGNLITSRNDIAHGTDITVAKPTAVKWRGIIEKLADRLDMVVADRIESETGTRPW